MSAVKLTKAQIENLQHVEAHGRAKPHSRAGHWCRTHGMTEWVFDNNDPKNLSLNIIGERLTDAGRTEIAAARALNGGE